MPRYLFTLVSVLALTSGPAWAQASLPTLAEVGLANVLNDAESVLDGKLLVPHPLLPQGYGVNVGAWFEDPSSLDIVDWIHGRGA